MLKMPEIRVGDPIRHEALSVFPLFLEAGDGLDYLLADEAIAAGTLTVSEVGESGSVPDLFVENTGDSRVLFIEGEELRGAKQNRVLNTSVLVAAGGKTKIPSVASSRGAGGTSRPTSAPAAAIPRRSSGTSSRSRSASRRCGARGTAPTRARSGARFSRQMSSLGVVVRRPAPCPTRSTRTVPAQAEYRERLRLRRGGDGPGRGGGQARWWRSTSSTSPRPAARPGTGS